MKRRSGARAGISTLRGAFHPEAGIAEEVARKVATVLREHDLADQPLGVDLVEMPILAALAAEGVAVVDGQQIYVPVIGEAPAAGAGGAGGLVNLNRATQSELEALPGIGPVTAEKIIAARAEQPFATLEELVTRDVLTARQRDQIADLVTVP